MLRQAAACLLLMVLAGSPVSGQQWARKMFQESRYDFGSLARGAKAEYRFELTNIYQQEVHVVSARSSCGCTSVRVEKSRLKTHEKGAIVASINTGSFFGQKSATITVTFDKPFYAEVQLQVSSYIRTDVTFEPGSVQFGSVEQGTPTERKVNVTYAGGSKWKIIEVRSANPHVTAEVVQTGRRGAQVSYKLIVHLSAEAPPGYIHDHLMLVTNEHETAQIPVAVEGRVSTGVTVSPAALFMGVVQPGEKVTKQLVIKGCKPFRILSITCDDRCFEFDTSTGNTPKPVHLIPVTFVAGPDAGKVTKTIRIQTDLADNRPELPAYAVVAEH